MKNERGVSGIILTVIMIVLVLAAVVIVWAVISNLITTQTGQVDISAKCLDVSIKASALSCTGANPDVCTVTLTRTSKGNTIDGVDLVFTNSSGTRNHVEDISGNIAPLGLVTTSAITTTGLINVNNVEVVPYFIDPVSGNKQRC